MSMGFTCAVSGLICLLFALLFTFLKGKAAILISGFNTLTRQQRELYDREKMSKDHRNAFFLWSAILGCGAVAAYVFSDYAAFVIFILWLAIAMKDVHFDEEKAFAKYKKEYKEEYKED